MNKLLICKINHKEFTQGKITLSGHIRRILKNDNYTLNESIELISFLTANNIVKISSKEIEYFLNKFGIDFYFVEGFYLTLELSIKPSNEYNSYWFIEWLKSKIVEEK